MAKLKIAVVTDDGERISSHLGMAHYYHVYDVEDGKIAHIEVREKPFHQSHDHHHGGHHHGRGGAAMFEPIKDCQVLIAGGMGQPAFQHAQAYDLDVVLSGGNVREAISAYLSGELKSDMRRVHQH